MDEIDNEWDAVLARLEQVRKAFANRGGMVANVTLIGTTTPVPGALSGEFCRWAAQRGHVVRRLEPLLDGRDEGLTLPLQVNFVGKSADLFGAATRRTAPSA